MFLSGLLSSSGFLRVNYTRKIVHFSWFFLPMMVFTLTNTTDSTSRIMLSMLVFLSIFVIISPFFRKKSVFLTKCFESIDRPEDQPKTLLWLVTQTIAGYIILISFYFLYSNYSVPVELIYLTILSVTIGDGLAEPIGIKFGKNNYKAKGFFDSRIYYRTIEGSSVVFITSLILCFLFSNFFENYPFLLLLLIYPTVLTVVEAKSPHTWDTPFMFLAGNTVVFFLHYFLKC